MKIRGRSLAPPARRSVALALLVFAAAAAFDARCIERTHVWVDRDGYTHITGEMVNDTDVQGAQIMLRGTLFDAAGNVLAVKDAPTCPPDTQPHHETTFDIRFDNPGIPPPARFDVRPISGRALDAPLPDPDVVVLEQAAIRFEGIPPIPGLPITDSDVLLEFGARNRSGHPLVGVQGCAAVYDQSGSVVFVSQGEVLELGPDGTPRPATMGSAAPVSIFMLAKDVPAGPVQIRAWLWFGAKGAPTSAYQFFETPLITIQTRRF